MRSKNYRLFLALVFSFLNNVATSKTAIAITRIRGGNSGEARKDESGDSTKDDNDNLDNYINQITQDISSSELSEDEILLSHEQKITEQSVNKETEEVFADKIDSSTENMPSSEVSKSDVNREIIESTNQIIPKTQRGKIKSRTRKRTHKRKPSSKLSGKEQTAPDTTSSVVPPPPPNKVFRFFLGKGIAGHCCVMLFVTLAEFINQYLPPLSKVLKFISLKSGFSSSRPFSSLDSQFATKGQHSYGSSYDKVNVQYGAFVSTSSSKVSRSKRKKIGQKMDLEALSKLKKIGSNIPDIKVIHTSLNFQKKHRLGDFLTLPGNLELNNPENVENNILTSNLEESQERRNKVGKAEKRIGFMKRGDNDFTELDGESDDEWVFSALFDDFLGSSKVQDKASTEREISSSFLDDLQTVDHEQYDSSPETYDSSFSSSLSTHEKQMLIHNLKRSFPSNSRKKKTKRDKQSSSKSNQEQSKGLSYLGSVVGMNSNTRILGAYPNDATPIEEAGNADGLFIIARKYGYGDWGNENHDLYDNSDEKEDKIAGKETKKTRRRKIKREKHPDDDDEREPFVSFEFSMSSGNKGVSSTSNRTSLNRGKDKVQYYQKEGTVPVKRSLILSRDGPVRDKPVLANQHETSPFVGNSIKNLKKDLTIPRENVRNRSISSSKKSNIPLVNLPFENSNKILRQKRRGNEYENEHE